MTHVGIYGPLQQGTYNNQKKLCKMYRIYLLIKKLVQRIKFFQYPIYISHQPHQWLTRINPIIQYLKDYKLHIHRPQYMESLLSTSNGKM